MLIIEGVEHRQHELNIKKEKVVSLKVDESALTEDIAYLIEV